VVSTQSTTRYGLVLFFFFFFFLPVKELLLRSRKIKLSTNKPSKRRREHDVGVQNNFCFATVLDDNKRSFLNK
jgi:hypothetical protein